MLFYVFTAAIRSCKFHAIEAFRRQVNADKKDDMKAQFYHLLGASNKYGFGSERVLELIEQLKKFVVDNSLQNEADTNVNFYSW